MVGLAELWLPILVSGVAVFFVSSIVHMVLPLHKSDYGTLSDEGKVLDAMRSGGIAPGHYMFPYASSMQEYASDEHVAKLRQGPVGFMTILPSGPINMGKQLGTWFLFTVLVSLVCAYVIGATTAPGAEFIDVFRLTAAFAFTVYGIGAMPESIWKGLSWRITAKYIFDGLLYGLATGAVFALMWPNPS